VPGRTALGGVDDRDRTCHVGDALVAEVDERTDGLGDRRTLVGGDAGQPRARVGVADDDGLGVEAGHQPGPRIADPRVGQQDAVDSAVVRQTPVGLRLRRRVRDDAEDEDVAGLREHGLDARQQLCEERVGRELAGGGR
jgi:hypothetical protein